MATNRLSYAIAFVTYVVAGVAWKPLLNWIVGPLWVVLVAGVLPDVVRSVAKQRTR
jgi:hypothetical protein